MKNLEQAISKLAEAFTGLVQAYSELSSEDKKDPIIQTLMPAIRENESFRSKCYDDATGKILRKGDVVRGTPTIGYGTTWVDEKMATILAEMHLAIYWESLNHALPWVVGLPQPAQEVLLEATYQLGLGKRPVGGNKGTGLLGFVNTLAAFQEQRWEDAIRGLESSAWAKQTPSRVAKHVAKLRALQG